MSDERQNLRALSTAMLGLGMMGASVAFLQASSGANLFDINISTGLPVRAQESPLAIDTFDTNAIRANSSAVTPTTNSTSSRAYVQATEALALGRSTLTLQLLEGMEDSLPQLADQVVMLRALAYEQADSPVSADRAWMQLLEEHPNSPLIPRALRGLGRVDELRSRFYEHPVTVEYLQDAVENQPQNFTYIRHLADAAPDTDELAMHLNRWRDSNGASFTAEDHQIIANAYWEQKEFGKASRAYQSAPGTALNLYRLGRSHQISREHTAAIAAYQRLLSQFPDTPEAGQARLKLAELVDTATAISLLRQEADRASDSSPAALQQLASLYSRAGNRPAAESVRQELWQTFPQSQAAAEVAWTIASQRANAGNWAGAVAVAQQVGAQQPTTEWGAQLNFWSGRWLNAQGDSAGATAAYRQVLQQARSSYYGWRAATLLGLPAGDFSSGRSAISLQYEPAILQLPEVSEAVQALHAAGAADDAWQRWQWENYNRSETTQSLFSRGVLQNRGSNYLDRLQGINTVSSLIAEAERGDPVALQLQQRPDFWQTVYPLHHYDTLVSEAETFGLNPLVLAGLIRQESRFEPEIVSRSGALGLTQVMPATGAWIAGQMGLQTSYNLSTANDNLHFGAFYLDYTHRRYQDNSMLAIASYNAGPNNVAQWTQRFSLSDPDLFVEQIPFPETRKYVKAVLGNYWNYLQIYAPNTNNLASRLADINASS
ncbi:MAG: transglycosylase SLT domain-containing protein [Cyanobacteria bacterium J06597_1]